MSGLKLRAAVVPCSARKLGHRAPARELYTGPLYRSAVLAAAALVEAGQLDRVLVLSARHGLVELEELLDPYNLKMGDPGSVTVGHVAGQLVQLAEAERQLVELVPMLPRAYAATLHAAAASCFPPLVELRANVLEGSRGLLEQRRRLRELREATLRNMRLEQLARDTRGEAAS